MGTFFRGGERIQRGRGVGIGGVLRMASKLFTPLKNVVQKALSSKTGKKIISSVKEQAIDSSINLAKDLASGKDLKRTPLSKRSELVLPCTVREYVKE